MSIFSLLILWNNWYFNSSIGSSVPPINIIDLAFSTTDSNLSEGLNNIY